MLRVLILAPPIDLPPSDGTTIRILELSRGLSKLGAKINLLVKLESQSSGIRSVNAFELASFSLVRPLSLSSYLIYACIWHIRMLSFGLKILLIRRPQLILCETFTPIVPALLIAKIGRLPLLLDIHSLKSSQLANEDSKFPLSLIRIIEKVSCFLADRLIVASRELQERLGELVPQSKIRYVPSGVDTKRFNPDIQGISIKKMFEDVPVIIFVGSLNYYPNRKAIQNIYKSAEAIDNLDAKIKFVIIGKGEPLKPIPKNVVYAGFVDTIEQYLAAADIAVLPYDKGTQDGIPVKLLEYVACGKPIVSTPEGVKNVPGLVDSENCLIVKNSDDMAKAILALLGDRKKATELGANVVNLANRYDWSRICCEFLEYIEEWLNPKLQIASNND